MLNKLRIGPKLLLAPGLVLVLLIVTAGAASIGMVRQNASLENLVQVRAARLKTTADVAGEARYAHAHIYQLLAWVNGSFAQSRLDELGLQIKTRHAGIEDELRRLASAATEADERRYVEQSLRALAEYRKAVLETMDMAAMDQSIATNAMAKAEKQFLLLNDQLAQLSNLEKRLSEQAHARATADFRALATAMAVIVLLSIVLSLGVTMAVRRAMLGDIRSIGEVVTALAAGRLGMSRRNDGRDEIADTARLLDQSMGNSRKRLSETGRYRTCNKSLGAGF